MGYIRSFIFFLVASLRIQPWAHLGKSTQTGEVIHLASDPTQQSPTPPQGRLESADKGGFYNSSDPHSLYFTDNKLRCKRVKWLVKPFAPLWRGSLRFPLFSPVRHGLLTVLGWECLSRPRTRRECSMWTSFIFQLHNQRRGEVLLNSFLVFLILCNFPNDFW